MKLRIRYDDTFQTIDLDNAATEELWVSLNIEEQPETQEEKEQLIQEEFEKQYNKPEYNNWHKFDRHRGFSKAKPDEDSDECTGDEPLMSEVADDRIFRKDELDRQEREEYEAVCDTIRKACGRKTDWAEMFIAIRIDGESVNDYAERIGADPSNISHKLERATQKIRKFYSDRQI